LTFTLHLHRLPRWLSGVNHCAAVRMACAWLSGSGGPELNSGSGGLLVHEIISGRHRGFDGVFFFKLWPLATAGFGNAQY